MSDLKPLRIKFQNFTFGLKSLRSKFILCFIVLSIIPMILLAYISYRVYLDILQRNVQTYTSEVIDRVDRNLQIYLSDLERVLELRNDYYIVQFIKLSLAKDIEGNRKYTFRLWENLNNIKQVKTDLRDVSITTLNGVTVGCYGVMHTDLLRNELFQNLINRSTQDDTMVIWGPHPDWLGGKVFSVGRAIRGDYDNFLGIMTIDVDMELLDQICRNIRLGKNGYIILVDNNGQIIYHPEPGQVGRPLNSLLGNSKVNQWNSKIFINRIGLQNQVIIVKKSTVANWKIIGLSNKTELTAEMQKITRLSLVLIIITMIALTIIAIFLASLLTKPIKELQQSMRRASEDLNTNVKVYTLDEIGQLGESFNQMLNRIRHLMEQSVQEQKKLRRTEMIALQEQIKPHFIYNTLDVIIGLLENNRNEEVIKMVEALGMFFRTSLNQGRERITVREEVEHIRNYLYIQKFRHGDNYDYQIDVAPQLLDCRIIKLILQPLVENAIYHGVRELGRPGGRIVVRGYLKDERICFEIEDNGIGMEEWKIERINQCFQHSDGEEPNYFGLRNVHQRIVLAFGKGYGLRLAPASGGGTLVTVHLPLLPDRKE